MLCLVSSGSTASRMRAGRVLRAAQHDGRRHAGRPVDDLDSADDLDFSGTTRVEDGVAAPVGDLGLVDLDQTRQAAAVRVYHGPAQLVQEQPGGLVVDADLVGELQRRDAVRVRGEQVRGGEPSPKRDLRPVHRRARITD